MKTPFQRFYSFFGFWSYELIEAYDKGYKCYKIIYWCLWPWKFKQKIDVLKIDCTTQFQKKVMR